MHLLCADDLVLSDSLQKAIAACNDVYLEVDMDNMMEMVQLMPKMKMRNDTTLSDLLSADEYAKVKAHFQGKGAVPFALLEKFKPMLAASTLMEGSMECSKPVSMEQLIMKVASRNGKKIKGLESMAYQMSIFDSIPYKLQAQQLVKMVDELKSDKDNKEFDELTSAYRNQELEKLEELTRRDNMGIGNFTELLLYQRNRAWAVKLQSLMGEGPLVIAVGAGHLPGEQGVIALLRKAGYKVEPVKNDMMKVKAQVGQP
jgi:hypothetical protein